VIVDEAREAISDLLGPRGAHVVVAPTPNRLRQRRLV
jgi:hypothetical protein